MAEIRTIHKWFWVWDFEKEEKWLNQMASEGWALKSIGYCRYDFEKCEPAQYIVRLELHDPSDSNYISFMEETGAQYLGHMLKWIYFRRESQLGAFDLYSDIDSRIQHLQRIINMLRLFLIANLTIGIVNSFNASHVGWLNLLVVALLAYGLGHLEEKIENLRSERLLRE